MFLMHPYIFTELAHWADSISKSRCPSVSVPLFAFFVKRLITPIYKGRKSNRPIAKKIL